MSTVLSGIVKAAADSLTTELTMITKKGTTKIAGRFIPGRLHGAIHPVFVGSVMLVILMLSFSLISLRADQTRAEICWSELIGSMDNMHMAMGAVVRSGNPDVDFVRLMLPHHQAAIDMAKTLLLYGKDAKMRRLAQEIITDQQLEIELMQRWLKQQESAAAKENQTPGPDSGKNN